MLYKVFRLKLLAVAPDGFRLGEAPLVTEGEQGKHRHLFHVHVHMLGVYPQDFQFKEAVTVAADGLFLKNSMYDGL